VITGPKCNLPFFAELLDNPEFVRGDYQMNSKQNLFYRYVNQHTEFFCSNCGGTSSSFSNLDNLIPRDMHAIGHTWVLSNRVLNEFYFMRATASELAQVPGISKAIAERLYSCLHGE